MCFKVRGVMKRQQPRWTAFVALVAAYALLLQALLSSLAPLAEARANPLDSVSIIICLSSGDVATQEKAPDVPPDHRHDACCILCAVPGLDAAIAGIQIAIPDYQSSWSSPLMTWIETGPFGATELLPIHPRAPPRFA